MRHNSASLWKEWPQTRELELKSWLWTGKILTEWPSKTKYSTGCPDSLSIVLIISHSARGLTHVGTTFYPHATVLVVAHFGKWCQESVPFAICFNHRCQWTLHECSTICLCRQQADKGDNRKLYKIQWTDTELSYHYGGEKQIFNVLKKTFTKLSWLIFEVKSQVLARGVAK